MTKEHAYAHEAGYQDGLKVDKNPTALQVAEKLTFAYNLACSAEIIICAIDDRKDATLTKEEIELLRDWLPDLESAIKDVIVAFVGHTLMEVE